MRRIVALAVATVTLLALVAVPAGAASAPLRVTIEDTVEFPGTGVFEASGPAVTAGAMCPSGTTSVTSSSRTDLSPQWALLRIRKVANCDDGTGTFNIRMTVLLNVTTGATTAGWIFRGGTGDYTRLFGVGGLIGTPIDLGDSILDTYRGWIRG